MDTSGNIHKDIGRRVRDLMESHDVLQTELGIMLGIHSTTLHNYLCGIRKFPLEHLVIIASMFGVSLDYLICGGPLNTKEVETISSDRSTLAVSCKGVSKIDRVVLVSRKKEYRAFCPEKG